MSFIESMNDAREELMNLRFQQATGELTDFTRLRHTRRQIARLMTMLHEREAKAGIGRWRMNNRRRMTGVVTSDKMEKTVVVEISRTYRHRLV